MDFAVDLVPFAIGWTIGMILNPSTLGPENKITANPDFHFFAETLMVFQPKIVFS